MPVCSHCGFESAGEACPLCGGPLQASEAPAAEFVAWEDPAGRFPQSLLATWLRSLFEPGSFYAGLRYGTSLARPVLYFLIVTILAAFFEFWWSSLGVAARVPFSGLYEEALWSEASALLGFFISPFAGLVGLFVWSLVLHLFALLLAPQRRPLAATIRVVCYAAGPGVFSAFPFLGGLIGIVWTLVLQVVGVRVAHRTTSGRAAAIVLAPLLLAMAMISFVVFLAVFALGISLIE